MQGLCCLDVQGAAAMDLLDIFMRQSREDPGTIVRAKTMLAEAYVRTVRAKIRRSFGPVPEKTPLNPRITGVLQRRHEEWLYLLRSSQVSHTQADLAEAGIPLDVAQQLGMGIDDL